MLSIQSTGLLVRLCLTEESSEAKGYTTSDWLSYVQSMEDGCLQTGIQLSLLNEKKQQTHSSLPTLCLESPSLLTACEPGPILLICPNFDSDQSHCGTATWSCDAWFLWQPEAITSRVFAQSQNLQIAHEETDGRYMLNKSWLCDTSSRYLCCFRNTQIQVLVVCVWHYPQLTLPLLPTSAFNSNCENVRLLHVMLY